MPLADYAHWNEEAPRIWWEEEGKHYEQDYEDWREEEMSAADAFAEELYEYEIDDLKALLDDRDYLARWPKAERIIKAVLQDRSAA